MSEQEKIIDNPGTAASPGDLGWQLGMMLRGYYELFEGATVGMPEGIRGFQVLSTVVHRDPPNQVALSTHLGIDRTVLTYLLDSLVEAELVERVPLPTDRRARKIIATEQGQETLTHYEERVAAFEADLLSNLDEESAKTFASILSKLAMDVHRSQPGTDPCEAIDRLH